MRGNMKNEKLIQQYVKMIIMIVFVCFANNKNMYCQWIQNNGQYQYVDSQTGQLVVNNWIQTNQGYYFLDTNGNMVKGWCLINGKYYYFGSNGLMQTGFITTNNDVYYLDVHNGAMVTGWIEVTTDGISEYYYFKENGTMAIGWLQINGKWYYFKDGKCMIGVWGNIDNHWYFFDKDGSIKTGWLNQNGKYYYLNPANGQMVTGFVEDASGNKYYLDPSNGTLVIGTTINIAGIMWTFDQAGRAVASQQTVVNTQQSASTFNTGDIVENGAKIMIGTAPGQNAQAVTNDIQAIKSNTQLTEGLTVGPS